MAKKKESTTKFKIYKIKEEYNINGIIYDLKNDLDDKQISYDIINKNGYNGIIYCTKSEPPWINCVFDLLEDNLKKKYQQNTNLSYVLLKNSSNDIIYGISGGQGYHLLNGFYEKNYGLNLIPKLVDNNVDVVKSITEDRLYENQIFDHRINRNTTSLKYEYNFTNLYKEIKLDLDKKSLIELDFIKNKDFENLKSIKLKNKDYISVEKSLTLKNFEYILDRLDSINKRPLNFELNSLVPVSSAENYRPSEILDKLISSILDEDANNYDIEIEGNNISEYLNNDEYYIICDELELNMSDNININWNTVKTWLIEHEIFNKKDLNTLFKKTKLITSQNGNQTYNDEFFNSLNCRYYDKETNKDYFLLNGNWYYLDYTFNEIITEKFNKIYTESENISKYLYENYPNLINNWGKITKKNEDNYNNSFKDDEKIIVAHTLKPDYLEIADLIIFDENNTRVFLICLKNKFGYSGCRDVYGQIEGSCHYLKNKLFSDNKIDTYYKSLKNKNNANLPVSLEKFRLILHNWKIIYIGGFTMSVT